MKLDLVNQYVRKKKRKRRAAIISSIGFVGIGILIAIAFSFLQVDRFTVYTPNDSELCLTIDEDKIRTTTKLVAPPLMNAGDTQYSEIPENITEGLGSKNNDSYFAYSFYLGGVGSASVIHYSLDLRLNKVSNNLEDAMRIMIIRNRDDPEIFAKANDDGSPKMIYDGERHEDEPTPIKITTPFEKNTKDIVFKAYDIKPGEFDKFTFVIWIDG